MQRLLFLVAVLWLSASTPAATIGDSDAYREIDPNEYVPGSPVTVTIYLSVYYVECEALALEDMPPQGWTVTDISDGGSWDDLNGKVKWGPWFGYGLPYMVSYKATPPPDEAGVKVFEGIISYDGEALPIGGEWEVDSAPLPTGMLAVDSTPIRGEIFVDGQSWGIAPQSREVPVGAYSVTFGGIDGYTTPAPQEVNVNVEQTTEVTGEYVQQTGVLSIDTTPVKVEVFVDGKSWGTAPLDNVVPVGVYNVTFGNVDGYTTPPPQEVSVSVEQTTEVTGQYVQHTGILSIDTTPVKGEVFVDDESWGTAPHEREVPVGSHTVSFGEVEGYTTPAPQQVTVQHNKTTAAEGVYEQQFGTLLADTAPVKGEVFVDGQSWGIAPQSRELPVGAYTVSFGDVEGYETPRDLPIRVEFMHPIDAIGVYERHTGRLIVDTAPVKAEVFVNGRSWGTAPQERRLPVGDYVVGFGDVDGYNTKPADQPVTIARDESVTVTGGYRNRYHLTVHNGAGSGTYDANEVALIQAVLPADASFVRWMGDTENVAEPNLPWTTVTMLADTELTAEYSQTFTLTVAQSGPGQVVQIPLNQTRFESGAEVELVAVPLAEGDRFLRWEGDVDPNDPNVLIVVKMTASKTVTAVFEEGGAGEAPPCALTGLVPGALLSLAALLLVRPGRRIRARVIRQKLH